MRAKPFILGLTTGVVGGLTAIFFTTPQTGKQLRSNISDTSTKAMQNFVEIQKHTNNIIETVVTLKNEVQNNMPKIINELKGSVTNYKQTIEEDTIKLKEEIESLQKSFDEIENNLSELNRKKANNEENS